ncbi:hypothetical protein M2459_002699 [Parabacteroides sp. PF5-5]|uniref:DUF5687 family protein n=1 Tax=unclassified Parabacteroides TaxID=2649774 RepID=UPI00247565A5|nr:MULTISPECIES: DUF5687 family protein [unclassified Parabacteroides]MDH6305912.1 hypothetical protein [Parabacteroides sp. PH5-39]MDH6316873.1 hypothetical protein [Parabacteroides sp. PF5-13]MDH6320624.1 hypothetical protein [Parabacteroides sp. PH5-13]MDH6324455.1 hypothetical protein [Parabacteroides sp. PH5-8]MDH6328058.1 hypothetical protein [Parabacteroides sp. PH5-41]
MLQKELQGHQWKAFERHPMYGRNMAVKIFMFLVFGMIAVYLLMFGFILSDLLLEVGAYSRGIDSFNYLLLYIFLADFLLKYMFKQSQTMQIVPYLALPVKRFRLFNFLLTKEFSNVWNLYLLLMLLPFVIKSVIPYYGAISTILYMLYIYLSCIGNSLLVNISNNLFRRNGWFLFLPVIVVAIIAGITFIPGLDVCDYAVRWGEWILEKNLLAWGAVLLVFGLFWYINLSMMREELYRALQGKKISEGGTFFRLSFLERLGSAGEFINLELKMIARSKRLKQQAFFGLFFVVYYFLMIDSEVFKLTYFFPLFFTMFVVGWVGLIMAQYMFTAESSFFDGLMTRNVSLLSMIKAKYLLYVSCSVVLLLLLMSLVYLGKLDFLFLVSVFFYTNGFLLFLMFQNAVYNKTYFSHAESGLFNWKGTSGNMMMVTMIAMFIPLGIVMIIKGVFSAAIAYYFMLIVGLGFVLTANLWLGWTYKRFLKRKYINMDGFRSDA